MDKFDVIQTFVRVVESGSFSTAARDLAVSQATVSKQISQLEMHLDSKLLSRTTRKLNLTEAGSRFYEDAKLILEQYDRAVGEMRRQKQQPTGKLRIATAVMFGRRQITPLLPRFMERYPEIFVEHHLSDQSTDLIQEGIDLSIRMGELKDSSYKARQIASISRVTVASPKFLEKHGAPQHPLDLAGLPCLIFLTQGSPYDWQFLDQDGKQFSIKVTGAYRANVSEAVREAALAGLGLWRTALSACAEELADGRLVSVLPEFNGRPIPVNAVMPVSGYIPHKTRVFIDFLIEEFSSKPWILTSTSPAR